MLEDITRHALFHEIHRSIEESATATVANLMAGRTELKYPPNCGFTAAEFAALKSIPRTRAMESALRKILADAAAHPMFHLFCLADGVVDPPPMTRIQKEDRSAVELPLHDGFFESYWAWRRRRPDPGWRLDTYKG
jgi:hypothetical protein